jgi:peptidoglycan/LPS O-acetylase OafA/YrhL
MRSASGRAAGLDGLRGIAALAVFAVHIWIYTAPERPPRETLLDFAVFELRLVVLLFFVLSGLLLFRDFARATIARSGAAEVRGYALRRVARVLPAYYVALAATFALLGGAGESGGVRPVERSDAWLFLVFGQNYSEGTLVRLNPVTWTLCLEVAFYALLPLLGWAAYRLGTARRVGALLAALVALGIGWNALVHFAGLGPVAAKALPTYLPYFALGMALCLWVEARVASAGERPRLGPLATAALAAGGLALVVADGVWHARAIYPGESWPIGVFHDLPAGLGFTAVIAAAYVGTGPGAAWTRLRPFAWVGVVSYGFYLWHVPLILAAKRAGLLPEGMLAATAVTLPVSLAVAAASWYWLERPILRRAARATARERGERRERRARGIAARTARTAP